MRNQDGPKVDLVIVIDTSRSMRDEAVALSEAAEIALQATELECPADLRAVWLGIEGSWKGTKFDRTVRDYLTAECKARESDLRGRNRGEVPGGGAQGDGARAMEDIAAGFDWRTGTQRAIFYLSDESLEGGGETVEQEDVEAATRAIATAKRRRVTVHTYLGTPTSRTKPESRERMQEEYARVAHATGGMAFSSDDPEIGFEAVLQDVLCVTQKMPAPSKKRQSVAAEAGSPSARQVVVERRGRRLARRSRFKKVKYRSRVILVKRKHKKRKKRRSRWPYHGGDCRISFWYPEPLGKKLSFKRGSWDLGRWRWF